MAGHPRDYQTICQHMDAFLDRVLESKEVGGASLPAMPALLPACPSSHASSPAKASAVAWCVGTRARGRVAPASAAAEGCPARRMWLVRCAKRLQARRRCSWGLGPPAQCRVYVEWQDRSCLTRYQGAGGTEVLRLILHA